MPPSSEQWKPVIALTMGDPCGVGPEVIVKALDSHSVYEQCLPVVVGEPLALRRAASVLGRSLEIRVISRSDAKELRSVLESGRPGIAYVVLPHGLSEGDIIVGRPTEATCRAVVRYIETAVHMALDGEVQAMSTCPIHKENLYRHGFEFPGHTEFIRSLTGAEDVVMMLAGPRLRVSLVTIHEALDDVSGLLSRERISRTIRITGEAMVRDFGMERPRIAVAGLNPHAGEGGRFGMEEKTRIEPAMRELGLSSYSVSGPYPPDTLFHRAYEGEFDAVVAMYHDQGLIPIKLVHFYEAVNISLGLPIIRTSVDHGTAYEIAGTGSAHAGSLLAALQLAATMACNRAKNRIPGA